MTTRVHAWTIVAAVAALAAADWVAADEHASAADRAEIVIQAGHPASIVTVAATRPGNSWYVTGGQDGTINVVDANGVLLRRIVVCDYWIRSAVFLSRDTLAVGCGDHHTYVIDAQRGRVIRSFRGESTAHYLASTQDGSTLIVGAGEQLTALDVTSGSVRWTYPIKGRMAALQVAEQAGALFVGAVFRESITLPEFSRDVWVESSVVDRISLGDGRLVARTEFDGRLRQLVASGDARYVVALGSRRQPIRQPGRVTYLAASLLIRPSESWLDEPLPTSGTAQISRSGQIGIVTRNGFEVFDVTTGRPLPGEQWTGAVTARDTVSISAQMLGTDSFVVDIPGLGGRHFNVVPRSVRVDSMHWTRSGFLALGMEDGQVQTWNTRSGVPVHAIEAHASPVHSVSAYGEGATVVTGGFDDGVKMYEFMSDTVSEVWHVKPDERDGVSTRDEWDRILYVGREDITPVKRPRAPIGLSTGPPPNTDELYRLTFGPFDRYLVATGRGVAKLIDRESWQARSLVREPELGTTEVDSAAFSADGQRVGLLIDDQVLVVAVPDGRLLRRLEVDPRARTLVFTDGADAAVFVAGGTGTINGWSLADWSPRRIDHATEVSALRYWAEGNMLVASGPSSDVSLIPLNGDSVLSLRGHSSAVTALALHPEDPLLASSGRDGSVVFWNLESREMLATLVPASPSDWVVADPDGFFDGPTESWQRVRFRVGEAMFAPEQLARHYWEPGLLQKVLTERKRMRTILGEQGESERLGDVTALVGSKAPILAVELESPRGQRQQRVSVAITDLGSGATDLRVFRNGTLVHRQDGPLPSRVDVDVVMMADHNALSAYAFSNDGVRSAIAKRSAYGPRQSRVTPSAHVLAIGVDDYPSKPLEYAVADAEAVAEGFSDFRPPGFELHLPRTLVDEQATRKAIRRALGEIAAVAQPEDFVVVYFAGHGERQRGQLHLLPHDYAAGSRGGELARTVSDADLQAWLEPIAASRILLIIDACHAGQALEADDMRWGPLNSTGLGQLAFEKGIYVVAASQGYQSALENSKLGHGLLTYAFVTDGLREMSADRAPEDGRLFVEELLRFVAERVPELHIESGRQRGFVPVDAEGEADASAPWLQRPRVYYSAELEQNPFLLREID